MTTNRTIKELLTVMLEHKDAFDLGLCYWTGRLLDSDLIIEGEYDVLKAYILSNKPISIYTIINKVFHRTNFYWRPGNINPRIRWIKRHIKKNS